MARRPARLALQPLDDRLVPAGLPPTPADPPALVADLSLPASTPLDPQFNGGRLVTIPLDRVADTLSNARLQTVPSAGGRTLTLAQRYGTTVVERRLPDGTPDPRFGANGRVPVTVPGDFEAAGVVARPGGGAAVTVGRNFFRSLPPGYGHIAVAPSVQVIGYTATGQRDELYTAAAAQALQGVYGYPVATAAAADGRAAVLYRTGGESPGFGVQMLTADGAADESFGPAGRREFSPADLGLAIESFAPPAPSVTVRPAAVAFGPDGGLVIAGTRTAEYQFPQSVDGQPVVTGKPSDSSLGFVLKLTTAGARDTGFGFNRNGVLTGLPGGVPSLIESADRLAVLADGRVVVGGTLGGRDYGYQTPTWYVSRFFADGRRDTSLGSGDPPPGTFFTEGPTGQFGNGRLVDLTVLADGRVVVLADETRPTPVSPPGIVADFYIPPDFTLTVIAPPGAESPVTRLRFDNRVALGVTADAGCGVLVGLSDRGGAAELVLARPAAVAGLTVGRLPDPGPLDPTQPPAPAPRYEVTTDGPRVTLTKIVGDVRLPGPAFAPFEASYTGTLNAVLADVDGDGTPELVVTPDAGGGPVVAVYRVDGSQVARFFGIDDPNFRGGARVAAGDLDGDGAADLIVTAGAGGGPRVAVFSGRGVATDRRKLMGDFFAFEPEQRGGAEVAAGDLNDDGRAELVFGAGVGGGPRVTVLDGFALAAGKRTVLFDQFAGDPARRDGARVRLQGRELQAAVGPGAGFKPLATFAIPARPVASRADASLLGTPVG